MSPQQNIVEKDLTIKWNQQEDRIIKFVEEDKTYDISDKVAAFDFKRAGIDKGSLVHVKIDTSLGEHGTVVHMTKAEVNTAPPQTQQPTSERTTSPAGSTSGTFTIKAIVEKTNGIIFAEEENKWYTMNLELLKPENIVRGCKVCITVEPPKGKGNPVIVAIKKIGEPEKKQWSGSKGRNDYNSPEKQESIEIQGAVDRAYTLAGVIFGNADVAKKLEKQEDIKKFITEHATFAFNLVQSLKTKK